MGSHMAGEKGYMVAEVEGDFLTRKSWNFWPLCGWMDGWMDSLDIMVLLSGLSGVLFFVCGVIA
jgi:hypothetical protein